MCRIETDAGTWGVESNERRKMKTMDERRWTKKGAGLGWMEIVYHDGHADGRD